LFHSSKKNERKKRRGFAKKLKKQRNEQERKRNGYEYDQLLFKKCPGETLLYGAWGEGGTEKSTPIFLVMKFCFSLKST
jgi:hypothetical protein